MKPDAHKQKASAKYKKKHGLGESAKTGPPETKKKGAKHVVGSVQGKETAKEASSTSNTGSLTDHGTAKVVLGASKQAETTQLKPKESSDAGSATRLEQEQQTFRSRKIISNWDRYEGLDLIRHDDDVDPQRGADFAALLNVSSTAQSQFRFADERDWDLSDTDLSDGNSSLHIDAVELATLLKCIPLHNRLNLDPAIFTSDQVARFKSVASSQPRSFKSRSKTAPTDSIEETPAKFIVDDFEDEFLQPYLSRAADDLCPIQVEPKTLEAKIDGGPNKTSLPPNIPGKTPDGVAASAGALSFENIKSPLNPEARKSGISPGQEHLSTLIGECEDSPKNLPKNKNSIMVQQTQPEELNKEDELDFLLSLDAPVKATEDRQQAESASDLPIDTNSVKQEKAIPTTDASSPSLPAANGSISQTSTTNLEDWLDTMLDD